MYNPEQAKSNALAIGRELDSFETGHRKTDLFGKTQYYQYSDVWAHAKRVTEMFKTLKPIAKDDRERLWQRYQAFCNVVRARQNEDHQESQANASTIEQEIERLQTTHYQSGLLGIIEYYRYGEFWTHAKQITEMFKTLKPLLRKDREPLWQRYQNACDEMRAVQNKEQENSRINRESIESKIKDAYFRAGGSAGISGVLADEKMLDEARAMQTEAINLMKERSLSKQDREACWQYWREVNTSIAQKREQLQEYNYHNIKAEVDNAYNAAYQGDPYDAQQSIKAVQSAMRGLRIEKFHRQELYDWLNKAWQETISRIGKIKQENGGKYQAWRERTEGHLARWEENIRKSGEYISSLEDQIERLEEQERGARSDDFAAMVRGWIDEKYGKIAEVNGQIRDLEGKIMDTRAKLDK